MEDIPPSYESATARDTWAVIAHYIPSSDLCAASLVCRRWHEIFVPFLWGAPASHFGTDNDAVYVALTRFRRTLKRVRPSVRMLTHTLHLPPALSEIYGGPKPAWLCDVLDDLPNLQSLLVSKLPFFDHNSLIALRRSLNEREAEHGINTYGLRLLLAQREPNTTSIGIAEALLRFPRLVYLDLSYTTPARDRMVLQMLSRMRDLQVLRLRGIGLRDEEVEILVNAIKTRVRFLDVRNNMLTDAAVRSLLQDCFMPPEASSTEGNSSAPWSTAIRPGSKSSLDPDCLKGENLDQYLLERLTSLTDCAVFEQLPHVGLTHLYIADNRLSVEGVASLLLSTRLHVLDCGTVDTAESIKRTQRPRSISNRWEAVPGVEKLIPILGNSASKNLAHLRINHAVLTEDAPSRDLATSVFMSELPASNVRVELENNECAAELDGANQVHELSAEPEQMFELADTSVPRPEGPPPQPRIVVSQRDEPLPGVRRGSVFAPEAVEEFTSQEPNEDQLAIRRGSAFAPEVVDDELDDGAPVLDATGSGMSRARSDTLQSLSRADSGTRQDHASPESESLQHLEDQLPGSDVRDVKIRALLSKRPKNQSLPLRNPDESSFPYFHPSHLPRLRTLVLTDVPSSVPASSPILTALKRFITACSDEALLATLQARCNYSLPPGLSRISAEHQHAKALFSLERIVLEITPVMPASDRPKGLTPWRSHSNPGLQKSSTGDHDSEKLWASAEHDFSFFDETECGIPDNEPEKYFPMAALNEKVVFMPEDDDSTHSETLSPSLPLSPAFPPSPAFRSFPPRSQSRPHSFIARSPTALSPSTALSPEQQAQAQTPQSPLSPTGTGADAALTEEPQVDVVAELAAFRRAKKAEYEQALVEERRRRSQNGAGGSKRNSLVLSTSALASGMNGPPSPAPSLGTALPVAVDGHWRGEVKVVRNAAPKGRSGVVDMYGNYFEKGYLYP